MTKNFLKVLISFPTGARSSEKTRLADSSLHWQPPFLRPRPETSFTKPVEMHTFIIKTAFPDCGEPQSCFPIRTRPAFHFQLWAGWGQCCLFLHRLRTGYKERFAIFRRTFGVSGILFFFFFNWTNGEWNPETVASIGLWGSQCYDWAEAGVGLALNFRMLWALWLFPERAKLLPKSFSFPGRNGISCENVTQKVLSPLSFQGCM